VATEFFKNPAHRCIRFDDLTEKGDVQANQYLIIDDGRGMVLDPGGAKQFGSLIVDLAAHLPTENLEYIFLSHQDPDVGAGLNGFLLMTSAKLCVSAIWERFIPSFTSKSIAAHRLISIPDEGTRLKLGNAELLVVPAHFLHSPGNFQVYDPISKTLFSGDLGASFFPRDPGTQSVTDFDAHLQYMTAFHRRYMASNKACVRWATMVRSLDIERMAPQHGAMLEGKPLVNRFIEWITHLQCGVDLYG
jgi:flavorubredoxin